jgi:hypothetical protein
MQRDPRVFLWDAREAGQRVMDFVAGRTREDYLADVLLRSAVERQLTIVGEGAERSRQARSAVAASMAVTRPHNGRREEPWRGEQAVAKLGVQGESGSKTGPLCGPVAVGCAGRARTRRLGVAQAGRSTVQNAQRVAATGIFDRHRGQSLTVESTSGSVLRRAMRRCIGSTTRK